MKPLAVFLVLCLGVTARADDVLPQAAPAKRYEKLAARSPFAPPSAGPAPVVPVATPPGPTWSDNLTVTSLMQSHGIYTATVTEKDTSTHYLVRSDVENRDNHLMVASVRWADRPEDIKVTLRKGTQFGDVHFDPSGSSSGGLPGSAPATALNRVAPPNPAANFHPPPPSTAPMTPPAGGPGNGLMRGRPVIRANPAPAPAQPPRPVINGLPNVKKPAIPGLTATDDDDDDDD